MDAVMLANTWQRLPPDARETMSFYSKATEKLPQQGQDVPNCHRLPMDLYLVGSNEQLAKIDAVFDLWLSQMGTVVWGTNLHKPKANDMLKDAAGIRYIVLRTSILDLGQRFKVYCQQVP